MFVCSCLVLFVDFRYCLVSFVVVCNRLVSIVTVCRIMLFCSWSLVVVLLSVGVIARCRLLLLVMFVFRLWWFVVGLRCLFCLG